MLYYLNIKTYICAMELSLEDIKGFMKDLIFDNPPETKYVVLTGTAGYEDFNFALQGIEVRLSVKNSRVQLKRLRHIWIFNIYKKHGPYKILFNNKTKRFKAMYFTTILGESNTAEACYTCYIKSHKENENKSNI